MTFASEHMSSQNSGRLSALLLWFAEKCPHCLRGCCAHAWHGPPGLRRWLQRDGDPPKQPSCAGVAAMGEPGWPHGQDGVMGRAFLTGAMGNKECRPPSCSNHLFLPSSNFYPDASLSIFFSAGWVFPLRGKAPGMLQTQPCSCTSLPPPSALPKEPNPHK